MTEHIAQAALAGAIAERNDLIAKQSRQLALYSRENSLLHHRNVELMRQNAMLRKRLEKGLLMLEPEPKPEKHPPCKGDAKKVDP